MDENNGMSESERPKAIVAFEALSVITVLLIMLLTDTDTPFWNLLEDAVTIALTLWVSRGRSRIARYAYTAVTLLAYIAIGGAFALKVVAPIPDTSLVAAVTFELLLLVLLWWPSVTAWLYGSPRTTADT